MEKTDRKSGILMPIFSLFNEYGIGGFGKECYDFIDFLSNSNVKVWQILPLVQTGYGNSPYSSVSSTSFNPFFISPEVLKDKGLLKSEDLIFLKTDKKRIDYGELNRVRFQTLKKAFSRFDIENQDFQKFVKGKSYRDYAVFMAIKDAYGDKPFYEWEEGLKRRDKKALLSFEREYKEEILFWQFIQYEALLEWKKVKEYANFKGVEILGDMPLYVALDSVDVWINPEYFKLDENYRPKKVAGVPPDYFSEKGQLWGNPVYDYDRLQKDGFSWWVNRIKKALKIYDYVRIDHFRGLDRYYEIDSDKKDATVGSWVKVPSEELFNKIKSCVKKDRIIAEDLGIIDDGVRELLSFTGYPGMKVLSFAFNGDENNLYLPENLPFNSVCYTGTHDNDTLLGLIENASMWDRKNIENGVKNSLHKMGIFEDVSTPKSIVNAVIELGFKSKAKWFIMPYADIICRGKEYRINEPGTVSVNNWSVRFSKEDFNEKISFKLKKAVKEYNR